MTQTGATQQGSEQAADKTAIRPFHVNVPEASVTGGLPSTWYSSEPTYVVEKGKPLVEMVKWGVPSAWFALWKLSLHQ